VRHLWYWQGLRWAPGGVLLLATAVALTVPMPVSARWAGWLLATVVAARLHGIAGDYYARTFPHLKPGARTGGGLAASAGLALALVADTQWTPPILVTAVVGASVLLAYGVATGGGRPHHVVGMAGLMALAPLPALGIVETARSRVLLCLVACGVLYPVMAVLDHRELAITHRIWQRRSMARR
jgi:hypothetical protein